MKEYKDGDIVKVVHCGVVRLAELKIEPRAKLYPDREEVLLSDCKIIEVLKLWGAK